jgi:predicted nucleic acid-binding protein
VIPIVYLDICCFKRPFDDIARERVRREAAAVAAILDAASAGRCQLVRSPAHDFENDRNPREDRRLATRLWLNAATILSGTDPATAGRARELTTLGVTALDSLHLTFAEHVAARWFVTTDDRLLKRARREHAQLRVAVALPDQVDLGPDEEPV